MEFPELIDQSNVPPEDRTIKINQNLVDADKLSYSLHHIGIRFPPIPFLWHYDDFAQPYPIYGIQKIGAHKFAQLSPFNNTSLTDANTDFYVLAQYKNEACFYPDAHDHTDIYVSFHTLLFRMHTGQTDIPFFKGFLKYGFHCGLFGSPGNIHHSETYPKMFNKKKKYYVSGGMPVNENLVVRSGSVHDIKNIMRFSSYGVCNFSAEQKNIVFTSVIRNPAIMNKKSARPMSNAKNCCVIHIFRNVPDNKPDDPEFQQLIQQHFV